MASNSILANMAVVLGANVAEFQKGMNLAKRELKGFERAGEAMKGVGENMFKYISLPLAGIAAVSLKTAGDIQALKMGLEAVMGSSEAAATEFERLKEVAKLPGLGLKEAAQGSVNLQAAGFSADLAARSLKAFGNALATVGKGRAELDGVNLALTQIINKPKVMAQELNQLRERLPQISGAMKKAFGTSSSEGIQALGIAPEKFVKSIIEQFEKLPPVTGGLKNSFENFADGVTISMSNIGDSINRALNVEGLISGVGEQIVALSNSFAALSGPVQGTIIVVAGLAAAAGPLILGLGAISAAIPTLAAGFAILTGPVGLITAGLVALTIAGVAWYQSSTKLSDSAVKGWQEQSRKVKDLEKNFVPLLDRYEELASKTKLSEKEQTELSLAIEQIAKVTPAAVTEFDKYGKALGISTEKAREFVKLQRDIAAIKNKESIDEQIKNLRRIDEEVNRINHVLAKGSNTRTLRDEFTTTTREVKLTQAEINKLILKLNELGSARNGTQGLINELKGISNAVKEISNTDAAPKPDDKKTTYQQLIEDLALADQKFKVFGDAMDTNREKAGLLQSGIGKLMQEGLSPQSEIIQKLAGQWRGLTAEMEDYNNRAEFGKDLKVMEGMVVPPAKEMPIQLKLLPIDPDAFKRVLTPIEQVFDDFSLRVTEMLKASIGDSFISLGEVIGTAVSGGNMEAALNGFLSIIFDFTASFGKALVGAGIAAASLGKLIKIGPAAAPYAIAAGVALIALSGIAKASLASGPKFGGGPSAPRSASPNYNTGYDGPGGGAFGQVVFEIQGDKLRGVLDRAQYRNQRLGG